MKKYLFIFILGVVVLSGCDNGSDADPKNDNDTETENNDGDHAKVDIGEEIKIGNVTIDLQSVTIEGDKLSIWAWWFHSAAREKIHFSVLAYPVVKQNGEELEMTDGDDTLLRKTDYGVDSNLDIEYQLIDDSPVEITFKTTTDDPEEETITVELE